MSKKSGFTPIIKDGNQTIMASSSRNISEIPEDGTFMLKPEMITGRYIPTHDGVKSYTVKVVGSSSDVNGMTMPFTVNSLKTFTPTVGVFKATALNSNEIPTISGVEFGNFVKQGKYLSSMYPVADGSFSISNAGSFTVTPVVKRSMFKDEESYKDAVDESLVIDALTLELYRRIYGLDRAITIVSGNFFADKFLEPTWGGGTLESDTLYRVGFVHADQPYTFAHELAHTAGVHYELYPTVANPNPPIVKVLGYDADPTGFFGQVASVKNVDSVMARDSGNLRWLDRLSYGIIFNSFLKQEQKAQTTWVTGVLNQDGIFKSVKSMQSSGGSISSSTVGGDVTISALDAQGKVLYQVSMNSKTTIHGQSVAGIAEERVLKSTPISVDFPMNANITSLRVTSAVATTTINLQGARLVGELERLPVEAFNGLGCNSKSKIEFQNKERQSLLNHAKSIQKLIDSGKVSSAKIDLAMLMAEIRLTVSAKYVPTNVYNISRSTAIGIVQSVMDSIETKSCKHKGN